MRGFLVVGGKLMLICAESDPLALRLLERQIAKLGQPFLSATTVNKR
jgi:hypothetical protein